MALVALNGRPPAAPAAAAAVADEGEMMGVVVKRPCPRLDVEGKFSGVLHVLLRSLYVGCTP